MFWLKFGGCRSSWEQAKSFSETASSFSGVFLQADHVGQKKIKWIDQINKHCLSIQSLIYVILLHFRALLKCWKQVFISLNWVTCSFIIMNMGSVVYFGLRHFLYSLFNHVWMTLTKNYTENEPLLWIKLTYCFSRSMSSVEAEDIKQRGLSATQV